MRAPITKALLGRVQAHMRQRLPRFAVVKDAHAPGGKLFEWEMGPASWAYVWVFPIPRGDIFTIELAWTPRQGFPASYAPLRQDEGPARLARFRLDELIDEPRPLERWSVGDCRIDPQTLLPFPPRPPAELVEAIEDRARDVVETVARFAIPYFERASRSKKGAARAR